MTFSKGASMAKFRIVYRDAVAAGPSEVTALGIDDNGEWIDFYSSQDPRPMFLLLRIRASNVHWIEQVQD